VLLPLGLLVAAENQGSGPRQALRIAEVEHLRGQIALDQRRGDAARLLLNAARRYEPLNPELARATHLEALWEAAMQSGERDTAGAVREAAVAARTAPPGPDPPRPVDVLLDAFALRFTQGHAPAAPAPEPGPGAGPRAGRGHRRSQPVAPAVRGRISQIIALELWDFESWHALATRQAQLARGAGALVHLQFALNYLARTHLLAGELTTAALMLEEDHLIAEATGNPPVTDTEVMLAAWRGREPEACELIEATVQEAAARGAGRMASFAAYVSSVLYNGLGRHDAARDAAWQAFEHGQLGHGSLVVSELAESAARTGDVAAARAALAWLSERTRVSPTDWALGIEARVRALLSEAGLGEGEDADRCHQESIRRLGRTRLRAELARAHLLYGEWLRREHRRAEAREQLRTAHEMLDTMGMEAFAGRARRELTSAGEPVRNVSGEPAGPYAVPAGAALTAQEALVARLARDGLSNPEIGSRLFISSRTVQYHLRKVFTKLGITSRSQLYRVLPSDPASASLR
jgi:DNA-binding CsgD family transcriptional regulator/tetratricopeptide (TPR) repeat protein